MDADPSMTPQQALASLAAVQGYRERLTAQAAGIVWMVWGLVVLAIGLATFYGSDHAREEVKPVAFALMGAVVAAGALLTNAVWRAHALEAEAHAPWVPYAAGLGTLAAVVGAVELVDWLLSEVLRSAMGRTPLGFAPLNLLAAAGALAIALLQRRRVAPAPGLAAAAALFVVYLVAKLGPWGSDYHAYFANSAWAGLALLAYFAVGLRTSANG
ncbi:MAG: hypothetical protein QOI63_1472 [Thermoplasmata archaeon]|jgi:hypothetical protein|nr:hypothetical protein [Thermoplasmata archaeon]